MTGSELIELFADAMTEVKRGASLEGAISYEAQEPGFYLVAGAYRVGNDLGQGGSVMVQGLPVYVAGRTSAGRWVRVEGDPYGGPDREKSRIWIDGELIDLRDAQMNRYRDGGTTNIETPKGNINLPSKLKVEQNPKLGPTLDGERLA
jgi:hypothetical protein